MKLSEIFRSTYDEHDAFYARCDLLRPKFGVWDADDPVSHALLDVVEAQRELNDLYYDDAGYGPAFVASFKAAVNKRHRAAEKLMQALNDREAWPDPSLGQ